MLSIIGWSSPLPFLGWFGEHKMFLLGSSTGHLRLVMCLNMDIDARPLDKGLVTISTGVRFFPGVKPLVVLSRPLGAESLATECAGLRLLASVGPLVLSQLGDSGGAVVTELALNNLLLRVFITPVHSQLLLVLEALSTLLTDDGVLADLVRVPHVLPQLLGAGKGPGALITLVTHHPRVDLGHVNLLVLQLPEILITVLKVTRVIFDSPHASLLFFVKHVSSPQLLPVTVKLVSPEEELGGEGLVAPVTG